jgi:hypothetical protein
MRLRRGGRIAGRVAIAATGFLTAFGIAACGEREEPEPTTTAPPVERAEKVPKLPERWKVLKVPDQGFALGQPPGWHKGKDCLAKNTSPGTATVLCSPDKLLTLSISADRTDEALEITSDEFARRVMAKLSENYQKPLDPGKPKPFKAHYDGAKVSATGQAAKGVREDVSVVVMRRDDIAVFTAVIASNAAKATGQHKKFAERALRTLRSQPVS